MVTLAYWCLVLLRPLMLGLPSFIHPDEHFQSPEVMAHTVFGFQTFTPWEFADVKSPCRSILPPALVSGLPFLLLKICGVRISCMSLLLAPRVLLLGLSFVLDLIIMRVCQRYRMNPSGPLVAWASSWPTLVLMLRPFSNTVEALLTTAVWSLLLLPDRRDRSTRTSFLGMVVALGLFTRFTFVAFVAPCMAFLAMSVVRIQSSIHVSIASAVLFVLAFAGMALFLVLVDSLYFGALRIAWPISGSVLLTPLNNFLYNANPANLAEHGLHPRFLHVLINFPLLMGPLAILAYTTGTRTLFIWLRRMRRGGHDSHKRRSADPSQRMARQLLGWTILSGLTFLSIAPHQELRFLLPLVIPTCILFGDWVAKSRTRTGVWILFQVIMVIAFGVVHQSGVILSLCHAQSSLVSTEPNMKALVYYRSYMPPRYLLALPSDDQQVKILDVGGDREDLEQALHGLVHESGTDDPCGVFVAAPASVPLSLRDGFHLVHSMWPHLSMEHPPRTLSQLRFNLYSFHNATQSPCQPSFCRKNTRSSGSQ